MQLEIKTKQPFTDPSKGDKHIKPDEQETEIIPTFRYMQRPSPPESADL
jgi:hypothetical protein